MAFTDRGSCVRASASAQNRDYSYTRREYYCSKCGKLQSRTDECCGIIKYRMVLIDSFASSADRRRIVKPAVKGGS